MFRGDVRFESWCHMRVTAHCCLPACCTPSKLAQSAGLAACVCCCRCRLLAAAAAAAAASAAAATHPGASISQSV